MDKKLHSIPPLQGSIGNLDTTYNSANISSCFLFEPKKSVQFEMAWNWQRNRQKILIEKPFSPSTIFLLQHFPCYTIGRASDPKNLCFEINKPPAPLYTIERGGEVTFHLPGQLVGYLILDLHRYKTDLNWYLRELEQVMIDLLALLDLPGERVRGATGVWCKGLKVGSIGIGCRKWVTQHGFSLNVDCDLSGFNKIVPCGLSNTKIGRLNYWIPGLKISDIQPLIKEVIRSRFELIWKN